MDHAKQPRGSGRGFPRPQSLLIWCMCLLNFAYLISTYSGNRYIPAVDDDDVSDAPQVQVVAQQQASKGDVVVDMRRSLTDAVNAMRCLTTPGCYPSINCANREAPKQVSIGRKWEQQAFCTGDLASPKGEGDEERCLVYSFGLYQSSDWEEKMATIFGCDVFAFDPTSTFPEKIAERVTFHKLGLQGGGADMSETHSEQYDAIDPERLRTLGEIVELLGHQNRKIDVLRMDCEGCEYGVLKELACSGDSKYVKQLMVEFHFQKNLGLANDADVLLAGEAVKCLEEERWGAVSIEQSGVGPDDQDYTDAALKFIKGTLFLMYVTFRRVPETEKLGHERYGDYVKAEHEMIFFGNIHKYHEKGWLDKLTEEEKTEQKRIWGTEREMRGALDALVHKRDSVFDKDFEVIEEKN